MIDGKIYGIPCIYAWSSENLYLCRTEDAEAAGIDWNTVNDLDSMTDAMISLKKANPDKYFLFLDLLILIGFQRALTTLAIQIILEY